MTYQINLQQSTSLTGEVSTDKNSMVIDALALYEDTFVDAHGQTVEITREIMNALTTSYKRSLKENHHAFDAIRTIFGKEPKKKYKNVSLNHVKDNVREVVGKILDLNIKELDGKSYLFAKLNILKKDNVESVDLGLWTDMSISFDYDDMEKTAELREISFVFDNAVKQAVCFSSFNNTPLQERKINVELESCREELNKNKETKQSIEAEMRRLEAKNQLSYQFNDFVKQGLVSRSDYKKLMIDLEFVDSSPQDALVRAISTVAKSKKAMRGKFNSNFSASAFENFVDNLQTPTRNTKGGKMSNNKMDPDKVADAIIKAANANKTLKEFAAVPADEKMVHGIKKEEKHEEAEHMIHFKKEDMHRMHEMLKAGKTHAEIMDYMKEMGYHHEEGMHDGMSHTHGDHHDQSATGANNAPWDKGMEYSAKEIKEKMVNLEAELKKTNDNISKLTDKLIDLSSTAPKGASSEGDKFRNLDPAACGIGHKPT